MLVGSLWEAHHHSEASRNRRSRGTRHQMKESGRLDAFTRNPNQSKHLFLLSSSNLFPDQASSLTLNLQLYSPTTTLPPPLPPPTHQLPPLQPRPLQFTPLNPSLSHPPPTSPPLKHSLPSLPLHSSTNPALTSNPNSNEASKMTTARQVKLSTRSSCRSRTSLIRLSPRTPPKLFSENPATNSRLKLLLLSR